MTEQIPDKERILEDLVRFLDQECGIPSGSIEPRTELIRSGVLDSFDVVKIISHLETTYGFQSDPLNTSIQELSSLNSIVDFVNDSCSPGVQQ